MISEFHSKLGDTEIWGWNKEAARYLTGGRIFKKNFFSGIKGGNII